MCRNGETAAPRILDSNVMIRNSALIFEIATQSFKACQHNKQVGATQLKNYFLLYGNIECKYEKLSKRT